MVTPVHAMNLLVPKLCSTYSTGSNVGQIFRDKCMLVGRIYRVQVVSKCSLEESFNSFVFVCYLIFTY